MLEWHHKRSEREECGFVGGKFITINKSQSPSTEISKLLGDFKRQARPSKEVR